MMTFLQLLLMKRGGELIYAGPLGPKSRELIKYFEVKLFIDASFLVTPIVKYLYMHKFSDVPVLCYVGS